MRQLLFITTSLSLFPLAALAADGDTPGGYGQAPHIVITGTRTPVPVSQLATSVTVIDAQEIARKNKANITELLREVPGVTVAGSGGVGQPTSMFLRGTNSNHVLVVMDGVRLNDPSNPNDAFDFSNLTTDNIERIEILRGPQSTAYGSQALGGVINIVTRKGRGAPSYNALAETGSYNSYRASAGTSGEAGRTSYSLQGGYQQTGGISGFDEQFGGEEKDSSTIMTFSTNLATRITEQFTAKFTGRYNRTETQFDSLGSFVRPYDDPDPVNDNRQINLRAAGELSLYEGFWKQELGVSLLHADRNATTEYYDALFNSFFGRQEYVGRRHAVDWIHHLQWNANNVTTIGMEAQRDYYRSSALAEVNVMNKAVFIDNQLRLNENIFFGISARGDFHETFGRQFTWKFAPGYDIPSTGTTLKASYGTSFKAPSLNQIYEPIYGNASLSPEKARGYELGIEQRLFAQRVTLSATLFRTDIEALITNAAAFPFQNINVGSARAQGIESGIQVRALPNLALHANHVYTQAENRRTGFDLTRRPKHQFNAGASYDYNDKTTLDTSVRYSSKRRDFDYAPPFGLVDTKSFTVVDLTASYKLTPKVTTYARLENLLDKRYEEVYGYGQPGRGIYVGVKASY